MPEGALSGAALSNCKTDCRKRLLLSQFPDLWQAFASAGFSLKFFVARTGYHRLESAIEGHECSSYQLSRGTCGRKRKTPVRSISRTVVAASCSKRHSSDIGRAIMTNVRHLSVRRLLCRTMHITPSRTLPLPFPRPLQLHPRRRQLLLPCRSHAPPPPPPPPPPSN